MPGADPQRPEPTLLWLAAPLVVSFTLRALLTSIDIPYTRWVEEPEAALAAIGLFFPLEFAYIACWVGCSSALTSHLGRAMGERNEPRLRQLLGVAARLLALLALGFLGVAALAWWIAPRLGLDEPVVRAFRTFAPIVLAGNAVIGLWSVIPDSLVKAHHDTRSTMAAGLVTAGLNLVLNTLFVPLLGWGVAGLALATTLARVGGLAYALLAVRRLEVRRRAAWGIDPARPSALLPAPHRALLALAIPSAMTYGLVSVESLFVNGLLRAFPDSTASIAAFALYQRAGTLLFMPVVAVAVAVLPFVARRIGEGRRGEVVPALRQAFLWAYGYGVLFVVPLCLLGGEPLARALSSGATSELAATAIRWLVPIGFLVAVPWALARPAFEGLQRPLPGLVLAVLRYIVLALPLGFLGAKLARTPFVGLVAGLLCASATTSLLALLWARKALQAKQVP